MLLNFLCYTDKQMQFTEHLYLTLNPAKCEAINISNKRSPINMDYHIGCQSVSSSHRIKYLGAVITPKLNWKDQCQFIVSKGTRQLNCLRWMMFGYTQEAKANAYKALVHLSLNMHVL